MTFSVDILIFLLEYRFLWRTQDGGSPSLHSCSLDLVRDMQYFHGHV